MEGDQQHIAECISITHMHILCIANYFNALI